jgi:hypothetical protein
VKEQSQGSKVKRAEPMLLAFSSSVLWSNLRWAGVSDRPSNIFPLTFCATAGPTSAAYVNTCWRCACE